MTAIGIIQLCLLATARAVTHEANPQRIQLHSEAESNATGSGTGSEVEGIEMQEGEEGPVVQTFASPWQDTSLGSLLPKPDWRGRRTRQRRKRRSRHRGSAALAGVWDGVVASLDRSVGKME